MHSFELPFNARGLDLDGFAFEFRPDGKFMLFREGAGFHLTLHPGEKSGTLDLHKTQEGPASTKADSHETLFSIQRSAMLDILRHLEPSFLGGFLSLIHPIPLEWLVAKGFCIVPLPTEFDLPRIARLGKRRRLKIDFVLLQRWFQPLKSHREISDRPDGSYLLYSRVRQRQHVFGVVIAKTIPSIGRQLFCLKLSELERFQRKLLKLLWQVLKAYYPESCKQMERLSREINN